MQSAKGGLVFGVHYAYSKISPLPSLLLKKGGLIFGRILYIYMHNTARTLYTAIHTASQLWCSARLLPLYIGEQIDKGDSNCLFMFTIVDYYPWQLATVDSYSRGMATVLLKKVHTRTTHNDYRIGTLYK